VFIATRPLLSSAIIMANHATIEVGMDILANTIVVIIDWDH